jgi:hypothetical protein
MGMLTVLQLARSATARNLGVGAGPTDFVGR